MQHVRACASNPTNVHVLMSDAGLDHIEFDCIESSPRSLVSSARARFNKTVDSEDLLEDDSSD